MEPVAPVAEEAMYQVVAAAAVLALVSGESPSWTSLQLFYLQSRRQSQHLCRESQPLPQHQRRHVWQMMTVGYVSLLS